MLKGIVQGNQISFGLGGLVVAVANVDSARLGFLVTDDCNFGVSLASTTVDGVNWFRDLPKMKLYCSSCPVRIFFWKVLLLVSTSMNKPFS
jgi:hypothetical protein